MSPKEAIIEWIRQMPDDATLSDIIAEISLREQIEEGLRELDAGQGIEHDEAMKRFEKRFPSQPSLGTR